MPSLGADMEDGTLVKWRVKPGDKVKRGDIIAEVDTQKGLIEIEVFDEGTIGKLLLEVGKKVPVGTVMAQIINDGEIKGVDKDKNIHEIIIEKPENEKPHVSAEAVESIPKSHIRASPLAKKIAEEKGIDISVLKGTGEGGVIGKDDVEKAITEMRSQLIVNKEKETSSPAENIRMAIAAAMSRSNREIPHYFLATNIDMSKALSFLSEANKKLPVAERLLMAALLIKAVASALKEVPDLNAWWENGIQNKKETNIGFVVSLRTGGIIVPTIHDSANKSLNELMSSLNDIIPRARALKLRSSELSDSTITITSLGDTGVETIFGMIYPPQVAIIGFGIIIEKPCVVDGKVLVRPILKASLSADHRASDGNTGSKFLISVKKYLEQPELL